MQFHFTDVLCKQLINNFKRPGDQGYWKRESIKCFISLLRRVTTYLIYVEMELLRYPCFKSTCYLVRNTSSPVTFYLTTTSKLVPSLSKYQVQVLPFIIDLCILNPMRNSFHIVFGVQPSFRCIHKLNVLLNE